MKPIIFSTEMVQAILAGRKTMTRRAVPLRIVHQFDWTKGLSDAVFVEQATGDVYDACYPAPYKVGSVLYVRETWYLDDFGYQFRVCDNGQIFYDDGSTKWKPSIHMPKEAARIFLKVTEVRCERLRDITEEDAIAEGVRIGIGGMPFFSCKDAYAALWDSLNEKRGYGWEINPWVWVYTFERIEGEVSV